MWKAKKLLLLFGDVAFLYVSLALALAVRYGDGGFIARFRVHFVPFSLLFLLWMFIFYLADLYRPATFATRKKLFRTLFQALMVAGIISVVVLYLFSGLFRLTPKTNLAMVGVFFFLIDGIFRLLFLHAFSIGSIAVSFLGASPLKQKIESYLRTNPHIGYSIAEWIDSPRPEDFKKFAHQGTQNETGLIVVVPDLIKNPGTAREMYKLLSEGMKIESLIDFYEEIFEQSPLEILEAEWFVEHIATRRPLYETVKRAADLVLGLALALVFLPFGLAVALLVPLSSRGPVFYTEKRAGKKGKPFTLYKFRSMVDGARNMGPAWTEKDDARVTPFGKFIRYTHLDEIPQLLNILRGDISFTGPRPEAMTLVEKYRSLPFYEMRHAVAPGLTGWAQINYGPSASIEEALEKLRYDIYYVKNRSFFLDLLVIARTIKHFFSYTNK